jgi:hypothetical protein
VPGSFSLAGRPRTGAGSAASRGGSRRVASASAVRLSGRRVSVEFAMI